MGARGGRLSWLLVEWALGRAHQVEETTMRTLEGQKAMLRRGIASAVLAVVIALTAFPLLAVGDGAQVETPAFSVGDEWQWDNKIYARVVAIEAGNPVIESNFDCREGCRFTWDKNLVAVAGTNKKGKPVSVSGLQLLEFPLHVGREWTQDVDLRTSGGFQRPFANQWKVESFEDVKVKAGTFKAFRISWYQQNRGPNGWTGSCSMWWSPEVKAFVKRAVHTSDWGSDWQLLSYTLK
jgi:hypothetical protein